MAICCSQKVLLNPVCVPPGHLLISTRWKGSSLCNSLSQHVKLMYSDEMGVVDFHPSSNTAVLFITEDELVTGLNYKRRIALLHRAKAPLRSVVVAQKTHINKKNFDALQKYAVMQMGFALIAVDRVETAAKLIAQMVICDAKHDQNPFRGKSKTSSTPDYFLIETVTHIQGLGPKKAQQLLLNFGNLVTLANASESSIASAIGPNLAANVYKFFHNDPKV